MVDETFLLGWEFSAKNKIIKPPDLFPFQRWWTEFYDFVCIERKKKSRPAINLCGKYCGSLSCVGYINPEIVSKSLQKPFLDLTVISFLFFLFFALLDANKYKKGYPLCSFTRSKLRRITTSILRPLFHGRKGERGLKSVETNPWWVPSIFPNLSRLAFLLFRDFVLFASQRQI